MLTLIVILKIQFRFIVIKTWEININWHLLWCRFPQKPDTRSLISRSTMYYYNVVRSRLFLYKKEQCELESERVRLKMYVRERENATILYALHVRLNSIFNDKLAHFKLTWTKVKLIRIGMTPHIIENVKWIDYW